MLFRSKIPICKSGGRDRAVWPKAENGTYTVRTGYMCLKKERNVEDKRASGSHYVKENVWKMIWKLPVTPRVRNFMWRACGNYLATNYNLWKKKIRKSVICPICEIGEETVEHALLQCDWALAVWYGMVWI